MGLVFAGPQAVYFSCIILSKAFKCGPEVSGIILCLQKNPRC